ncbi:hypothetical protein GCM10009844_34720 [Nocardioides koreensis]|uniref:Fe-S cluster assembly protein HesB n=1 Tax=Nocardioides koreensis TaxID=433651 RepID=A0ABN3A1F5_9ACTN
MLTMTENARDILRKIPDQPDQPAGAGLRIARSRGSRSTFTTALADAPRRGDEIVDHDGARVFLGPVAARRFTDARLDARTDVVGRIQFVVKHGS